jgi:hypothetical protein
VTDFESALTYIPLKKGFLYLVAIMDLFSRNVLSWKLSNSLTQSSVWMPLRWHWEAAVGQRSSTLIKAASSPLATSWRGCRLRRSGSAGQGGSAATTTSWWRGCGERSSTRRCTCVPTAMAGRQRSAWPASSGGTAMVDRTAPWEAKLPMGSIMEPNPVPPARG